MRNGRKLEPHLLQLLRLTSLKLECNYCAQLVQSPFRKFLKRSLFVSVNKRWVGRAVATGSGRAVATDNGRDVATDSGRAVATDSGRTAATDRQFNILQLQFALFAILAQ